MASTINDLYRRRQGASLTTCAPAQPTCTTCGMLECVCRPRFFAGQVLNADDLNRLDAYIRSKNRLHNRQLHGWGVVNGLEVMCNPCGDGVAVGCGYALSPCGEDIVVCDAVTVDVCNLISRCKDAERKRGPCLPYQNPHAVDCDAGEEEWILAIRYSETPARGVKPLYAPTQADCGCGGGKATCTCGTGKASCGCGAKTASKCTCGTQTSAQCGCSSNAKPRTAPVQCEPTVVCEGFAFEVYRKPPDKVVDPRQPATINPDSPLVQRFLCCYNDLVKNAPQIPGAFDPAAISANPASWNAWYQWACQYKQHLLTHYEYASGYNCDLIAKLQMLVIVLPNPQGIVAFTWAVVIMFLVLLDALLACLCSALLPPCPMPTDEQRVPLAVLHVAGNPCRVMRVCNWTVYRKFATTFPALQYWLSVLPYGAALRQSLQNACCFDVTSIFRNQFQTRDAAPANFAMGAPPAQPAAAAAAAGAAGAPDVGPAAAFFREQAMLRLNPKLAKPNQIGDASSLIAQTLFSGKPLEPEQLINTLLAPKGDAARLAPEQSANLPQFLLLNEIAKPITQAALGPLMEATLGNLAASSLGGAPDATELRAEVDALRSKVASNAAEVARVKRVQNAADPAALGVEIANLRATVEQHAAEIERLRGGKAPPAPKKPRKGPR